METKSPKILRLNGKLIGWIWQDDDGLRCGMSRPSFNASKFAAARGQRVDSKAHAVRILGRIFGRRASL